MDPRLQGNQASAHTASDYLADVMFFKANAKTIQIVGRPLFFIDIPQKSPERLFGTCNVRSPGDHINLPAVIAVEHNDAVSVALPLR